MGPRPRRYRRWRATLAGLLLTAMATFAGCGTIGALADLTLALQAAGFSGVGVNIDSRAGGSGLLIDADRPLGSTVDEAREEAALIAWETFPRRFESLRVNIDDSSSVVYQRADLEEMFGPRDSDLDASTLEDDTRRMGIYALIAIAVGGLLCVGLIVLIIVLVRRSNRKKREAMARWATDHGAWPPGGPPGAGYGYPPAPGPGFPPPAPGPGFPPPPPGTGPPPWPPSGALTEQPPDDPPKPPNQTPPGWG